MIDEKKLQEWIERLRECQKDSDTESAHGDADDILCDVLETLGLNDLVEEYDKIGKWYA